MDDQAPEDRRVDGNGFFPPRVPLAQALAALPLEAPMASAWPALAARLPRRRAPARWPFALAAGVLALALLPRGWLGEAAGPALPADAASQRQQLAALMSESARLERLVDAASDDGASSGTATAVALELEDRLRDVDVALANAPDTRRQLPLWEQRVDLLRDVAAIEASRHYLASQGDRLDVALVAAY